MSLKPKHQRLVLVLGALGALLLAVLLAGWGLRDRAAYFRTPADIVGGGVEQGQAMRLGGMVAPGSIARAADGLTIRFTVTDGSASVPVRYRGIVPDLFREGSGVVAEGKLEGRTFVADTILAKHDERYMPPQMGNQVAEHAAGRTVAR